MLKKLAEEGVKIGKKIRKLVAKTPIKKRAKRIPSATKKRYSQYIDAAAEELAFKELKRFGKKHAITIKAVQANQKLTPILIHDAATKKVVYCLLDAIDGTIKITGLGNQRNKVRVVNDGAWAFSIAFTEATQKDSQKLTFKDFKAAALVDGNPSPSKAFPEIALTYPVKGKLQTFDGKGKRLYTSSNTDLQQNFIHIDFFQRKQKNKQQNSIQNLQIVMKEVLLTSFACMAQ